nr:interleukin-6 [Zootoca vivipara]
MPVGDSSGESEFSDDSSARTVPPERLQLQKCVDLARWLQGRAAGLTRELCKKEAACQGKMELALNNLNLPKITQEDKCFDTGFEKETCLGRLSSGLYAFGTFFEYLEEASVETAETFRPSTEHLANTLRSMMNNPETVTLPDPAAQKILAAKLREHRGWAVTIIKHFILQDFTLFMQKTTRALRIL